MLHNKKKVEFLKLMLLTTASVLLISSCETSEIQIKSKVQPDPLGSKEARLEYARQHFEVIGTNILKLNLHEGFKETMALQVEKKLTGESSILIDRLLESEMLTSQASNQRIKSLIESPEELNASINAFKDLDGVDYYPQVFIPFYEEIKQKKANGEIASDSSPVIVFFYGDDEIDLFPGYVIDEGGALKELDFLISEDYAKNNETWVISISERFHGEDKVEASDVPKNGRVEDSPDATIPEMRVKCHKETWAGGASEVHIIAIFSAWGWSPAELELYGGSNNKGGKIHEFSVSEVDDQDLVSVNFSLMNDWDERLPNEPYINYVIFEYDPWPAGKKTVEWWHGTQKFTWDYRSSNDNYDDGIVHKTSLNFHIVSTPCIEWSGDYF